MSWVRLYGDIAQKSDHSGDDRKNVKSMRAALQRQVMRRSRIAVVEDRYAAIFRSVEAAVRA